MLVMPAFFFARVTHSTVPRIDGRGGIGVLLSNRVNGRVVARFFVYIYK